MQYCAILVTTGDLIYFVLSNSDFRFRLFKFIEFMIRIVEHKLYTINILLAYNNEILCTHRNDAILKKSKKRISFIIILCENSNYFLELWIKKISSSFNNQNDIECEY